ncbi:MAG: PKD domain-containing protein, partial [Ilumatobacter sp.]
DGGTPTLAWDFDGDGQFDDATGLTPTFDPSLFGAPGSNTVAVQATDDEGVTATDTATVTIKTDPLVDAGGPYTVEEDRRVRLAATTSDPDGGTPTLAWDFDGDGLFDDDTDDNPQFDSKDFGAPGENIVTVQATDDEGETVTDTAIVKITTDPVVDAGGPYTVFGGATVTLSATTSDADGGTPDLAWDFDDDGDFDDATGATPTFDTNTFGDPGQNDIAVQATDDEGVIETDSTRLTIVAILGATFDPGPATSLDPERFVDTRSTGATFDQRFQGEGMRLAGSDYRVAIAGRGGVPVDAVAVVANITAVRPQANGFITAHPCLAPRPLASSLNYSANVNLGNEVIIPLTSDGEICLYTRSSTHMTIDVSGYIDVQSPIELISPARFLDTRATGETIDGSAQARGRVNAGTTYRLDVAGRGDIPDDAAAVIVNVTAVGADATGYVTVHPCLATTPNAASLNYIAGVNRGNETIAQLDANGDLCLFTRSNVHLTADISGYLSSDGADAAVDSEAITLEPVGPSRFVDTRFSGTTVDGFDQAIGQLRAGSQIRIQVAGRDGIPSNVDTVELNVTAIQAEANGYITIHPCQDPRPNIASLNYVAGVNGGNAVLTRLDPTGHMCIFSLSATQLTIDITNYVSPAPA